MQPTAEIISIGVMSCANIAVRSVIPAIQMHPAFSLAAVASRDPLKAAAVATTFQCAHESSYDALLARKDIEAVYIPLPTGLHEEWVTKALAAGKHVFTEKSLAMDQPAAERIIEAAVSRQRVLMEDFMYRYHAQHAYVFDLLHSGFIGELRLFRSSFGFPPLPSDNFRYSRQLGGGALLDAAAYTVNAARWFLGNEIEVQDAQLFDSALHDVCLYGSASLRHPVTGLAAQIAFGFDNYYQCSYELWGSKGKITVERAFTPPPDLAPTVKLERQGELQTVQLKPDNHFYNILDEFAQCIRNGAYQKHRNDLFHQSRLLTEMEQRAKIRRV